MPGFGTLGAPNPWAAATAPAASQSGLDYVGENTGVPAMPTFISPLGSNGQLQSQYDVTNEAANLPALNTQPLSNLESFASSGSNNPWVQAQMAAQQQAQGQAMGAAESNAQAGNTAAEDAMAARGGLNTGAMQNLARNAGNNSALAGQGVIGQGLQQQGQIQSQNAQNELGVAENLPGQEVQSLQPGLQEAQLGNQANEFNTSNALTGLNSQNLFNMTNYQNQIAQQAGNEEATAQANSGKK